MNDFLHSSPKPLHPNIEAVVSLIDRPSESPLPAPEPAWFCLHTKPRHEHLAAANLRRHHGLEVLSPRIRFQRSSSRGPVWVTESLFPNYLFARFDRILQVETVRHTGGVAGVVHFGTFWPTVSEKVIAELRQLIGQEEIRTIEHSVESGDEVEVAVGAFRGFEGIVTRVLPARRRVAVLLEFLGRQAVVELSLENLVINGLRYGVRPVQPQAMSMI